MEMKLDALRYLKEHHILLIKAAEAAGMAQQNITKSLAGNPTIGTLLRMCNNLGIDIRELFYPVEELQNEVADAVTDLDAVKEAIDGQDEKPVPAEQSVASVAFCPHCGAKVRVGVVLLAD